MDDDYEVGIAVWRNGKAVVTERYKMFDQKEMNKIYDIMVGMLSVVVRGTREDK